MPELPEIESVNRALNKSIIGYRLIGAVFYRKTLRTPIPIKEIQSKMLGKKIDQVSRRSKYLLLSSKSHTLLAHFGMTGNFLVKTVPKPEFKHTHYVLELRKGRTTKYLHYIDPRRFGLLDIFQTATLNQHRLLEKLGPEPLEHRRLADHLLSAGRKSKKPIKSFLMDAHNVVGVGNIYASESLFLSQISPLRPTCDLKGPEWKILATSIKKVLRKAIKAGGTTLKDFKTTDGTPGYFAVKLNVYDRTDLPCHLCKNLIETTRQAGRSTFFCSNCQK